MKSTQLTRATLARLRGDLDKYGIRHYRVADAAGVTKFMVSHVLAGRAKSANVVGHVRRLIAEAKAQQVA